MAFSGFIWRTVLTVLIAVDYFLFVTGNPSVTYSLLGGWFIAPLLLGLIIGVSYAIAQWRAVPGRRFVLAYVFIVAITAGTLFAFSREARDHASDSLGKYAAEVVQDPGTKTVRASQATRGLLVEIRKYPYTLQRDAFIPTFRRIDYQVRSERLGQFTLSLTMSWNGVPDVSVLPQSG